MFPLHSVKRNGWTFFALIILIHYVDAKKKIEGFCSRIKGHEDEKKKKRFFLYAFRIKSYKRYYIKVYQMNVKLNT